MNRDFPRDWLSLHVFLSDPVRAEDYLRECVSPAVAQWRADKLLERWFFIRYWEGGPHLRIRLAGPIARDRARAMAQLSERVSAYRASNPPTREAYYAAHSFDGQPVVVDDLPWYADGSVVSITYEPEILRYGGEHAIDANEQLFDLSSRLALSLCKASEGNRSSRPSSAFVLMATAILACGEGIPGVGAYFEQYGAVWASTVGREVLDTPAPRPSEEQMQLLVRLEREAAAGWDGKSAHAIWGAGVRQLAERMKALHGQGRLGMPYDGRATEGDEMCRYAVLGIVGSQIHMLNNRLGIPSAGEFLLARLLTGAVYALNQQDAMT